MKDNSNLLLNLSPDNTGRLTDEAGRLMLQKAAKLIHKCDSSPLQPVALAGSAAALLVSAPPGRLIDDWPVFRRRRRRSAHSPLKQINRGNVRTLRQVWQFDSGDQFDGSEMECTPVVIGGVLYATTPRLRVIALTRYRQAVLGFRRASAAKRSPANNVTAACPTGPDGNEARLFVGIDEVSVVARCAYRPSR